LSTYDTTYDTAQSDSSSASSSSQLSSSQLSSSQSSWSPALGASGSTGLARWPAVGFGVGDPLEGEGVVACGAGVEAFGDGCGVVVGDGLMTTGPPRSGFEDAMTILGPTTAPVMATAIAAITITRESLIGTILAGTR